MNIPVIIFFLFCLLTNQALAHETEAGKADIALDEKLGQFLPDQALFRDENGKLLNLKEYIKKPTIIAPVYLGCMHTCPMLLSGLAQVLGRIDLLKPGRDFEVITLSFDENDTPAVAAAKKGNYLTAIGRPFPPEAWKFLTGDRDNIRKFTESIGFRFQRDGEHDFSHPVVLVIIAPGGKVVRYQEGVSFLPFEVSMALTEASQGKVGSPAHKALMYCFSYDPLKKSYVFNILKVTGTAMVLFVGGFFVYLMMTSKKKTEN